MRWIDSVCLLWFGASAQQRQQPDAVWRYVSIDCSSVEHETLEGKNCQADCKPCFGTPEEVNHCLDKAGLLHCQYGFFGLITRHMDICRSGQYSWILFEKDDHLALRLNETRAMSLWFFNRTRMPDDCVLSDSPDVNNRPQIATLALPSTYESGDNAHTTSCDVDPTRALPDLPWHDVEVKLAPQLESSIAVKINSTLTQDLVEGLRPPFAIALRTKRCGLDLVTLPGEGPAVEVGSWAPFPPRSWRAASMRAYKPSSILSLALILSLISHS